MKKNLLIGNGINSNTESNNHLFSPENIKNRFYKELKNIKYTEAEHELKIHLNQWLITKEDINENIEKIANAAYFYVKDNISDKENFTNSNNDIRLKKILTNASINAIFLNNEKFINIEIIDSIKDQLLKYENIYTLNYYEYWDESDKVQYLHGNIKIDNTMNTNILDATSCVFSVKLGKQKSKESAVYTCDNLVPSEDLHPNGEKKLYDELNGLDMIGIFGVSPSNDRELMESIRSVNKKIIYIYNIDNQKISNWKQCVGESTFLDAKNFIEKRSTNE